MCYEKTEFGPESVSGRLRFNVAHCENAATFDGLSRIIASGLRN